MPDLKDLFIDFLIRHEAFDKFCEHYDAPITTNVDAYLDIKEPEHYVKSAFNWEVSGDAMYWVDLHYTWHKELAKHET